MKIGVLGAGIHGLLTALELADRGHDVTVFDRWPPGHSNGSSHGRSRIIRKAYPDRFHTGIMAKAYGLWRELESRCTRDFVYEPGLLYFGNENSGELAKVRESLGSQHVEMSLRRQGQVDGIALNRNEIAIFTPEAGWVNADTAIGEVFRLLLEAGAKFQEEDVRDIERLEKSFDGVILACGAWIGTFAPIETTVRVQTVAYVEHLYDGPVWIEDGPNFLYGFPTAPGESTMKVGVHEGGQEWDLAKPRPGPDASALAKIADLAERRFGIESLRIAETVTCLYTMTTDEMFRWGRCGKKSLYVSACSGHGFKFGPWIGRRMADFAEGMDSPESIPQFCRR